MGEAYLFGNGGGSGSGSGGGSNLANAYAVIHGDCPLGCLVVCTNGIKTYTDKSGSGVFAFGVNAGGNWSITISKDSKTRTKNVTIEEEHQIIYVTIKFEIVIVEGRELDEDITGGITLIGTKIDQYEKPEAPTISYLDDHIQIANTYNAYGYISGAAYTTNKIDLTSYSTISVVATGMMRQPNTNVSWGVLSDTPTPNGAFPVLLAKGVSTSSGSNLTGNIDISALKGAFHVFLYKAYSCGGINISQFKIE